MEIDLRLKDIIRSASFDNLPQSNVAVLGFPFDEGVRRNGGRVGSRNGPEAFRKLAYRICASDSSTALDFKDKLTVLDCGNISSEVSETSEQLQLLEKGHQELTVAVEKLLRAETIPFVVGGGNDQSYPNASALLRYAASQRKSVLVINLDAHLDVRPLKENRVHSGSPFRLMLEDALFQQCDGRFIEFGAQSSQCSLAHVKYLQSVHDGRRRGEIKWLSDLQAAGVVNSFQTILTNCQHDYIFVSFDLDCVRAADAPGVSCSSPDGLTAQEAISICRLAGSDSRVQLFDLSEYNPVIDEYQTGRLVAMMFHAFLCGVCERTQ